MKKEWLTVPFAVIVVFFTLLFLNSCEKDIIPPEPVGQPVIFSDYTTNNGIVTLNWASEYATSVTCNGKSVPLSGNVSFQAVDSIFLFVAHRDTVKVTKIIQVTKPDSPTGSAYFTHNGVRVDSLPYPGGEFTVIISFANGILLFNSLEYKNSPVSIVLNTIGTNVFDFTIKGIYEEKIISLVVPVKEISNDMKNMLFTWRMCKGEESYDSVNWVSDGVDYTVIDCITDNVYVFQPEYFLSDWKTLCEGGVDNPSPHSWDILPDGKFIGLYPQRTILLPVREMYVWIYYCPAYTWDSESQKFIEIKRWRRETFAHVN